MIELISNSCGITRLSDPQAPRLCRQLLKSDQERKEDLLVAIGQDVFEERQTIWQLRLDVIAEGLLRREFFMAALFD